MPKLQNWKNQTLTPNDEKPLFVKTWSFLVSRQPKERGHHRAPSGADRGHAGGVSFRCCEESTLDQM